MRSSGNTGTADDKKSSQTGHANPWLEAFNTALGDRGNVTEDEQLFVADPQIFALVREVLDHYPDEALALLHRVPCGAPAGAIHLVSTSGRPVLARQPECRHGVLRGRMRGSG
ncbi:hypothetical protein MRX96_008421 [Rhipicephalus microplus]